MKKIIILLLLLSCLSTTSCSCSCSRRTSKDEIVQTNIDTPRELSYSDLKEIVREPEKSINIKQIGNVISKDRTNVKPLDCLGSTLYFSFYENKWFVNNVDQRSFYITDIAEEGLSANLTNYHGVYYSKQYPFIVYAEKINNNRFKIYYRNCCGKILLEQERNGETVIEGVSSIKLLHYTYFVVSYSSGEKVYFKYTRNENYASSGEIYDVTCSSQAEYREAESNSRLYPIDAESNYYDKKGRLLCSIAKSNRANKLWVLDRNSSFINTIDLDGYNTNFIYEINLENKVYFISEGSKNVKTRYLEIDLITGKEQFHNSLDYVIDSSRTYYSKYNNFQYTYVTFYKIDSKGEIGYQKYCAILTDEFNFSNPFFYDGFLGTVYSLDGQNLIAQYDQEVYMITKNNEKIDLDASYYFFDGDSEIILRRKNGNYYIAKTKRIIQLNTGLYKANHIYSGSGYSFMDEYTTNDSRVCGRYLEDGSVYTDVNTIPQKFAWLYISFGLEVNENRIYDNKAIYSNEQKISDVNLIGQVDDVYYFEVTIEDSDEVDMFTIHRFEYLG